MPIKGIDNGLLTNAYGITVPILFAINKGWHTKSKNGFSTSIFLSVIDLGAPIAFRFENDKTEAIPSVELKDIYFARCFLSVGLPRVPISINADWQMALFRDVSADVAALSDSKYSRISLSIAVDILILNVYKSAR